MFSELPDAAAPLLLAALGGLFTELAGVLNIALEGMILISAFTSLAVTWLTGSLLLGVTAGIAAALVLAALLGWGGLIRKGNIFLVGLAMNLFAGGLVNLAAKELFGTAGTFRPRNLPEMVQTAGLNPIVIIALLLIPAAWIVIAKTRFGYDLRAVGIDSELARTKGISPLKIQFAALLISAVFCGLAGAHLSLKLGAWVPGMSGGRGWMALVLIFIGLKKPAGVSTAAFIFAFLLSLSLRWQDFLNIPRTIVLALPYLVIILLIVSVSLIRGKKKN